MVSVCARLLPKPMAGLAAMAHGTCGATFAAMSSTADEIRAATSTQKGGQVGVWGRGRRAERRTSDVGNRNRKVPFLKSQKLRSPILRETLNLTLTNAVGGRGRGARRARAARFCSFT
jgi:hypothetical protein